MWLELVDAGGGPSTLFVVLVGYTAFTLAMMAQFGRDTWRANGETFTVWFRLLGRLAPYALVDEDGPGPPATVRERAARGAAGATSDAVLVALGVGSILFDGLSQTQAWFELFGAPGIPGESLLLIGWLGLLVTAALLLTRVVGVAATGAGLLPIAVGYLIAHYLTYLLIDGQNILIAISDPFQRGLGPFRDRLPRFVGGVAATGPGLDRAARGGGRRPHAGRLGWPRERGRPHAGWT